MWAPKKFYGVIMHDRRYVFGADRGLHLRDERKSGGVSNPMVFEYAIILWTTQEEEKCGVGWSSHA
jgi:hypothetical protein